MRKNPVRQGLHFLTNYGGPQKLGRCRLVLAETLLDAVKGKWENHGFND